MSIRCRAVGSTLSRVLIGMVAMLGLAQTAQAGDPLVGGNLKKHLSGPEIEVDRSLIGKVVLFQYVGFKCKDCRNSMRQVLEMQSKHAEGGSFAVVFSHVQGEGDAAREYFATKAPTVPVYADLKPPHAVPKGRTPNGYLFDHRGQIVGSGKLAELLPQIDDLVAAVPSREPPPLLGDFQADALVSEADALTDPATPAAPTLAVLRRLAITEEPHADEARRLVAQVERWLAAEPERLKFVAECDLAAAAVQTAKFLKRFKDTGAVVEQRVRSLRSSLNARPGVPDYLAAYRDLDLAAAASDEAQAAGYVHRARLALERIQRNAAVAPALLDAAEELLARAKQI